MMAAYEAMPGGEPSEPPAYLIVNDGSSQRRVPIFDQLFVGRECAGINEACRLVLTPKSVKMNPKFVYLGQ
jgi:adenylate cyclase